MEEEKTLIKSTSLWAKKLKRIVIILLIASLAITLVSTILVPIYRNKSTELYQAHHHREYSNWSGTYYNKEDKDWKDYENKYYSLRRTFNFLLVSQEVGLFALLPLSVVLLIVFLYSSKMEITITDKRVYGKAAFGKRVDLPLDSVSAVGTGMFKGLAVATSAGKIKFVGMDKRDELHKTISQLLIDRQGKETIKESPKIEVASSSADELEKYKGLFDKGIITQEEFEAKKKQLLGL